MSNTAELWTAYVEDIHLASDPAVHTAKELCQLYIHLAALIACEKLYLFVAKIRKRRVVPLSE